MWIKCGFSVDFNMLCDKKQAALDVELKKGSDSFRVTASLYQNCHFTTARFIY